MRVTVGGAISTGVSAKDIVMAFIRRVSADGAVGYAIEFAGEAIAALGVEGRMTICNMAVEAGARGAIVAPDDKVFAYLEHRPRAPTGALWDQAEAYWRTLTSDPGTAFDCEVALDASTIAPLVTWGTSPDQAVAIEDSVPDPAQESDPARRAGMVRALEYMGLAPGTPMETVQIGHAFIGSCTNARIEDLREAAGVLRGRHVAAGVRAIVVPGSSEVRRLAEAEGLDRVFLDSGCEWRQSGCSMCLAMNDDVLAPGERCASSTNRNFEGRQGTGARTHLMSPAMVAAAAVTGHLADIRKFAVGV
jgi:3-isopropylmalate/(R)-2-methylmalate dehydratase large subunit